LDEVPKKTKMGLLQARLVGIEKVLEMLAPDFNYQVIDETENWEEISPSSLGRFSFQLGICLSGVSHIRCLR